MLQLKVTSEKMSRLENDLACCRFRNCELSTDLDAAVVKTNALHVVNAQLEHHLAATRLAHRYHPASTLLQKESEYRKAVESALYSSIAELDHFRKTNFGIQAFTIHKSQWGRHESAALDNSVPVSTQQMEPVNGRSAAEQDSAGDPNSTSMGVQSRSQHRQSSRSYPCGMLQDATIMETKSPCTLGHSNLQMPSKAAQVASTADRNARHAQPVFLHTTQGMATSHQKYTDLLHQNISLVKSNAILQKAAVDHESMATKLNLRNQVLVQQVSTNECAWGMNATVYMRHRLTDNILQ